MRLKEIAQDLEVPEGMGVILRTAGAARTKTEVKRDFEYLLRLWETVRDLTLKSTAPKLVYEEGSLVKRSIRDLYSKDIDEIIVAGDDGYQGSARLHAHAHAEPCQEREALQGPAAAVHALRRREPARRHVLAGGAAAVRRLHRHQPGRSAGRHRRQLRPRHARAPYRGHRAQDQLRGGRGSRAPAAPARSRRAHRHRLHRHGRDPQQPHGRAQAEGGAQARPRPHPGRPHLAFRPVGNVAPAHPLLGAGEFDREMPGLRRLRPRALGLLGVAAASARDRGNADQGRHA